MKRLIFFLCLFCAGAVSGQDIDRSDLWITGQDTLIIIRANEKIAHGVSKRDESIEVPYFLRFYGDFSVYELFKVNKTHGGAIFSTISWGDYKAHGDKIVFRDRVAGFKMQAFQEEDGFRFSEDYFPSIYKYVWNIEGADEIENCNGNMARFFAFFDRHKAKVFRENYNKQNRESYEFTPGTYYGYYRFEIDGSGKWRQMDREVVLAEGRWKRKGNIIILNSPKLKCNFYMIIAEDRLVSMLTLGDVLGGYYYNKANYERIYQTTID